jgi:dipeptidyl aminopeptidase/acylaminoacyl peptidase
MTAAVGSPSTCSTRRRQVREVRENAGPEVPAAMGSPAHAPAPVRRAVGLVLALVLLVGVACSSPSARENPPSEPSAASTRSSEAPAVGDGEEWIVFQGAPLGLSLIRPDGSGNHVILGPPGDQLHPDWSPDGSQIAYVQRDGPDAQQILITDPQGTKPQPLVKEYPAKLSSLVWDNPAWSPDGSQIATVGYEGDPATQLPERSVLAIVTVASGEVTVVGELESSAGLLHSTPRWSPAGDAFVISLDHIKGDEWVGSRIAVIRRTGAGWSKPKPITKIVGGPRADWHPTDDLIVFCTNDVGGFPVSDEPSNLFTVRSDGSKLSQITDYGPGKERASQQTWTADGRIIFDRITGANDERGTVAFINSDGSGLEIAVGNEFIGESGLPHPRLRPVAR